MQKLAKGSNHPALACIEAQIQVMLTVSEFSNGCLTYFESGNSPDQRLQIDPDHATFFVLLRLADRCVKARDAMEEAFTKQSDSTNVSINMSKFPDLSVDVAKVLKDASFSQEVSFLAKNLAAFLAERRVILERIMVFWGSKCWKKNLPDDADLQTVLAAAKESIDNIDGDRMTDALTALDEARLDSFSCSTTLHCYFCKVLR